jgi:rubrerythrin
MVTTLQELEFDHLLGKIPEEDFPTLRTSLMQRGADLLRKIDELQPPAQPIAADDRLEAAISARRLAVAHAHNGGNGSNGVHVPDDALEQMIAVRRRGRQEKAGGFCPKCGGVVQQSDRFCPKCGASIV